MPAMTPARLREIAERLNTLCSEIRMHVEESADLRIACDGCKADAAALRELADGWDRFKLFFEAPEHSPWNTSAKPN